MSPSRRLVTSLAKLASVAAEYPPEPQAIQTGCASSFPRFSPPLEISALNQPGRSSLVDE